MRRLGGPWGAAGGGVTGRRPERLLQGGGDGRGRRYWTAEGALSGPSRARRWEGGLDLAASGGRGCGPAGRPLRGAEGDGRADPDPGGLLPGRETGAAGGTGPRRGALSGPSWARRWEGGLTLAASGARGCGSAWRHLGRGRTRGDRDARGRGGDGPGAWGGISPPHPERLAGRSGPAGGARRPRRGAEGGGRAGRRFEGAQRGDEGTGVSGPGREGGAIQACRAGGRRTCVTGQPWGAAPEARDGTRKRREKEGKGKRRRGRPMARNNLFFLLNF